ncbi:MULTISPECIES: hypothetical protein [unclassified Spiroplasma]|nr:hypothetical protein [Spiroplasma endosymbiont of Danaus chrysippus]CAB1054203.1 hypothetical protein [Spiroplasma endosymbiont of Danaus chrysippus]
MDDYNYISREKLIKFLEESEKNYEAINIKWLKKEIEDGEFIE